MYLTLLRLSASVCLFTPYNGSAFNFVNIGSANSTGMVMHIFPGFHCGIDDIVMPQEFESWDVVIHSLYQYGHQMFENIRIG